jgi:hypothetical protein
MEEPRWRGYFRISENPWIEHHKVQQRVIYPAAGMVVMAVEAAKQVVDSSIDGPADILDIEILQFKAERPIVIPSGNSALEHTFSARKIGDSISAGINTWRFEFTIHTTPDESLPSEVNARGHLSVSFRARGLKNRREDFRAPPAKNWLAASQESNLRTRGMSPREFYERLDIVGMNYGPLFRNITWIGVPSQDSEHTSSMGCWTKVSIPNTVAEMPEQFEYPHIIHPATLDAIFQTLFTLRDDPMIPVSIESIRISPKIPSKAGIEFHGYSHAHILDETEAVANITMWLDPTAKPVVEVRGLKVISLPSYTGSTPSYLSSHRVLCSEIVWKEDVDFAAFRSLEDWLELLGHKHPDMKILQIGGDEQTLLEVFNSLTDLNGNHDNHTPRLARYTLRSRDEVTEAVRKSVPERLQAIIKHESLKSILDTSTLYDLLIVDPSEKLKPQTLQLISDDGYLILYGTSMTYMLDSAAQVEELRRCQAMLPESVAHIEYASADGSILCLRRQPPEHERIWVDIVILVPPSPPKEALDLGLALRDHISNQLHCHPPTMMTLQEFRELYSLQPDQEVDAFFLCLLDVDPIEPSIFDMDEETYTRLQWLLERITNGLLWITLGGQMESHNPSCSLFLGWARTIRSEDQQKNIACLDISSLDANVVVPVVYSIFMENLVKSRSTEGNMSVKEAEYAERAGRIYIPRLVPLRKINNVIEHGQGRPIDITKERLGCSRLRLKANNTRQESTYFVVDPDGNRPLKSREIRIAVKTSHLVPANTSSANPRNGYNNVVLDVMGVVSEMGQDVVGFCIGDDVLGLSHGPLQTSVIIDHAFVRHLHQFYQVSFSNTLSDTERVVDERISCRDFCATLSPSAFIIAGLCLQSLQRESTALIRDAAGLYGQAAIQIAQSMDVEVFATIVDDYQRQLIREVYGIMDSHILVEDSDFASKLRLLTDGGVDLVFSTVDGGTRVVSDFECVANCKY